MPFHPRVLPVARHWRTHALAGHSLAIVMTIAGLSLFASAVRVVDVALAGATRSPQRPAAAVVEDGAQAAEAPSVDATLILAPSAADAISL